MKSLLSAILFASLLEVLFIPLAGPIAAQSATITLSPTSGQAGSTVHYTLSGFYPGDGGQITMGNKIVGGYSVDLSGSGSGAFSVPLRISAGTYTVSTGSFDGRVLATATFIVTGVVPSVTTPNPSPTPNPVAQTISPGALTTLAAASAVLLAIGGAALGAFALRSGGSVSEFALKWYRRPRFPVHGKGLRDISATPANHLSQRPGGNWESDNAVDIKAKCMTPVVAIEAGKIGPPSQFGPLKSQLKIPKPDPQLAGLRLHLVTKDNEFYYAHLMKFAVGIEPGVQVSAGTVLGYVGKAAEVCHLHFGAKFGNPVDILSGSGGKTLASNYQSKGLSESKGLSDQGE